MPPCQSFYKQMANTAVAFGQLDLLLPGGISFSDFRHSSEDGAIRTAAGTSLDLHCGSPSWLCLIGFLLSEATRVRHNDEPA